MAFLWSNTFRSYTPTADQEAAGGYDDDNLSNTIRPTTPWRGTDLLQQDIILNLGSDLSWVGVYLFGSNFPTVQLAHQPNALGGYTDFVSSPFTMTKDIDRHRKLYAAESQTKQYIRIRIPAQTADDGAAFFQLMMGLVVQTTTTLTRNPEEDLSLTIDRPHHKNGLEAYREVRPAGHFFLTMTWHGILSPADFAGWDALAALGEDQAFMLYYNDGNTEEVYFLERAGAYSVERNGRKRTTDLKFKERI